MKYTISNIAALIDIDTKYKSDIEICGISSIEAPRPSTVVLISKLSLLKKVNLIQDTIYLISEDLKKYFTEDGNVLISKNPLYDFAKIAELFYIQKDSPENFSRFEDISTSNIQFGKNCLIGKNSSIGDNSKIGSNVVIGDDVTIMNNCTIANNVTILHDSIICDNVSVSSGTVIGSEGFGNVRDDIGEWRHIPHFGGVYIHKNVSIGANCCIDRGTIGDTVINQGVIIDNLVHIAHNVIIGENTAIAAKVGIAGSCIIGKRNMIGGMVGIIDHIKTADDVTISATSTVTKHLKEAGIYTGIIPISKHSIWKRNVSWILKLDKIANLINFKRIKS